MRIECGSSMLLFVIFFVVPMRIEYMSLSLFFAVYTVYSAENHYFVVRIS
jgi:hypothetical protein